MKHFFSVFWRVGKWALLVIAVLWGIAAFGTKFAQCEGALGSGVQCAAPGILGAFFEFYLPSLEILILFIPIIAVFGGITAVVLRVLISLYRYARNNRESSW